MKQISLFAAAAMVIAAMSCTQEESIESVVAGTYMDFDAVFAYNTDDTRTALQSDGKIVWWSPKEEISIFFGNFCKGKFVSNNDSPQAKVTFEGVFDETPHGEALYWAVYPYDDGNACDGESVTLTVSHFQEAVEGTFGDKLFPAVAVSKSQQFAFYNVCGGIKFSVNRDDIKYVRLSGNKGEALAGTIKVGINAYGVPEVIGVIAGKTEITVISPAGSNFNPGKDYYISVLPGSLDGGFTMSFMSATEEGKVVSDKPQTVKRSVFGVLKNIDSKAKWKSVIPDAVDLGLSVKWASFNIGATAPQEYGEFYAWGETEIKGNYSWPTYKWCDGTPTTLTKYNKESGYGIVDNLIDLEPEDDVARVKLGRSWRMPTPAETKELLDKCTWKQCTINGVAGFEAMSPFNGNTIFLPATGCKVNTILDREGDMGGYWASSTSRSPVAPNIWPGITDYYSLHLYFSISLDFVSFTGTNRYDGRPIRPVLDYEVTCIELDKSELTLYEGKKAVLTAEVLPSNATNKSVIWLSSDSSVAGVDDDGLVTGIEAGTATITATTVEGGYQAKCSVTVKSLPALTEIGKTFEAVDLGLSVKWASFNLGATKPEEYGDYFAWGEVEPYYKAGYAQSDNPVWKDGKESGYYWPSYTWCNGNYDKLTKYCLSNQTGFWDGTGSPDNLTQLDSEDDAATVILGGVWRMPTTAEQDDLRNKCTWTWTTVKGVNGRLVTGPNGNSIFLPAAGYRLDTFLSGVGFWGDYWSSSLYTGLPAGRVCSLDFDSDNFRWSGNNRYNGFSIRPVSE